MIDVTLCMIVKNEERYLRDCLNSAVGIVDEIVVVDTGSEDETIEIAKSFGANVYNFEWINDFSAARNFALSKSNGRWILYLDADERLSADSREELKAIVKGKELFGAKCIIDCPDTHNHKPSVMVYPRLFPNDERLRFEGKVHEQILPVLKRYNFNIIQTNIKIIHVGYDVPIEEIREKARRNLTLLLDEFQKEPKIYTAFQIAQSYGVLEDDENVRKYFTYILNTKESPTVYKSNALRYFAASEFNKNHLENAANFAMKAFNLDKEQPLLNALISQIFVLQGNYQKALEFINLAYFHNNSEIKEEFKITANKTDLLYQALQVSALAQNLKFFNYYLEELFQHDSENVNKNQFLQLVSRLFNKEPLEIEKLEEYSKFIDTKSCNLIFTLLDEFPFYDQKLRLLKQLEGEVTTTPEYYNSLGLIYMKNGELKRAIENFETSISIQIKEPSTIFYLVSLYIQFDDYSKIGELIKLGETHFSWSPEVIEKINQLKQKISQLF